MIGRGDNCGAGPSCACVSADMTPMWHKRASSSKCSGICELPAPRNASVHPVVRQLSHLVIIIALMGPPASGKSTLSNLAGKAGMRVINLASDQSHLHQRASEAVHQQRRATRTAILTMPARVSFYTSLPKGIVRVLLAPGDGPYRERWASRCVISTARNKGRRSGKCTRTAPYMLRPDSSQRKTVFNLTEAMLYADVVLQSDNSCSEQTLIDMSEMVLRWTSVKVPRVVK